jgi:hypothetical protein
MMPTRTSQSGPLASPCPRSLEILASKMGRPWALRPLPCRIRCHAAGDVDRTHVSTAQRKGECQAACKEGRGGSQRSSEHQGARLAQHASTRFHSAIHQAACPEASGSQAQPPTATARLEACQPKQQQRRRQPPAMRPAWRFGPDPPMQQPQSAANTRPASRPPLQTT